jgi:4-hydroxybenzoate polyprenyltransferase
MMNTLKNELALLMKLGRLKMTIFSAVTYSTCFTVGLHLDHMILDCGTFLFGWSFVLLCQLSAHFLGEFYDLRADLANLQGSPFTGGSRVLVQQGYSPTRCWIMGWTCGVLSLMSLCLLLPERVHMVGYLFSNHNIISAYTEDIV